MFCIQKYFVLRAKKGLITDGLFSLCRNPNYLGEMMIYGSFAGHPQSSIYLPYEGVACLCRLTLSTAVGTSSAYQLNHSLSSHVANHGLQSRLPAYHLNHSYRPYGYSFP